MDEKAALRARLLVERRAMAPAEREIANIAIHRHLAALAKRYETIAGYVPFGTEPGGPAEDFLAMLAPARVLLPVVRPDSDLDWATHDGRLAPTARAMREPLGPRLGVSAVTIATLVLVPALAVDLSGGRLGRGGGSYDRALARVNPVIPVAAVLYDHELLDHVPMAHHDRRVSMVIRPVGVQGVGVS